MSTLVPPSLPAVAEKRAKRVRFLESFLISKTKVLWKQTRELKPVMLVIFVFWAVDVYINQAVEHFNKHWKEVIKLK